MNFRHEFTASSLGPQQTFFYFNERLDVLLRAGSGHRIKNIFIQVCCTWRGLGVARHVAKGQLYFWSLKSVLS